MASKIQRELALLLTGKDISASKAVKGVDAALKDLNKAGRNAATNVGRNIERAAIVGATAATAAIGYAVNQAMSFEAQLNTINTIAREDALGLAGIGDSIRAESRATGTALEDLSAAYYDLLSAGIAASAAPKVLHDANTLAIGGLSTTAEAVDLLTTAINTYGGDASQSARFADEFAVAIERGKVTAEELAASYASVGPLAAAMNIENAELAAGYARLTAGGTQAGEATTQMASAITALLKKTAGLKRLEKQTGRNYAAIAGKDGLATAYEQLRVDADKAGVSLTDLLGRKEAMLYLLQVTGPNFDAYNADLAAVGDSAGTAAEQMGERQKGLSYELKRLRANIDSAAITIGNKLLPVLADLAAEGTAWLEANQEEIGQFAEDLARGLKDAVGWAKSLDWDAIGAGLSMAAGAAKLLIEAFTSAPPWLQGFLMTGFLANKFTGGAVVDIAGILLGQMVKGVLGMNAGVVNINAGVVNGGGAAGAAGAGAAGAGAKGLLVNVLKFIPVVALAGLASAFEDEITGFAQDLRTQLLGESFPKLDPSTLQWPFGPANTPTILPEVFGGNGLLGGSGDGAGSRTVKTFVTNQPKFSQDNDPDKRQWRNDNPDAPKLYAEARATKAEMIRLRDQANRNKDDQVAAGRADTNQEIANTRRTGSETRRSIDTGAMRSVSATRAAEMAARGAGVQGVMATNRQTATLVAALWASARANRAIISPTTVERTTTRQTRSGDSNASRHE
jgi:TP901 family phage tail tape measure protein